VFSAARLSGNGASYLYAVLHGSDHASDSDHRAVATDLRQSYALREAAMLTAAGVLLSLLAGLALIGVITRPLRRLSGAMESFQASNFAESPMPAVPGGADDEVARIGHTFDRMAARIRAQVEELHKADGELRDMFAAISHDLRTPLASVQGYLETLLLKYDCLPDAERKRYAEIAAQQAERLAALVSALFDLAKLESRQVRLNIERFNLADLAQDVVQKFELPGSRKGVSLRVDMPRKLPLVAADLTLLERVLDNLIENALRHTPAGGGIVISAVPENGEVRISVADTGSGIAQEDLPHVFDRFYRGRNAGPHPREGAGLGLAFVKRVLELHGSTVGARSTPGAGATFSFRLPTTFSGPGGQAPAASGAPANGEKVSNARPADS
jgi:signal transduction histidine kinase